MTQQDLAKLSLKKLVELFELTANMKDPMTPTVRGWLMGAIEAKNPDGFDAWLESDLASDESLRDFVL